MLKLLKKVAIGTVVFFGILAVLGAIISVVDPEGTKRRQEQSEKAAEQKGEQSAATKRIFTHGFTAGYSMAKGGAVKPSSDEVDALARRAANELRESDGLGFTTTWKNAFWAGWKKGD